MKLLLSERYYRAGQVDKCLEINAEIAGEVLNHPGTRGWSGAFIAKMAELCMELEDFERAKYLIQNCETSELKLDGVAIKVESKGFYVEYPADVPFWDRLVAISFRLKRMEGATDQTADEFERAFIPRGRPLVKGDRAAGYVLIAVAVAHRDEGNGRRALELLEQAEPYLQGEEESDLRCNRWREVALTESGLGRTEQAEAAIRQALAECERGYGKRHPDYARCQLVLAELLRAQQRNAEAEPLLVEVLDIYDSAGCVACPIYARGLGIYCDLLRATGRSEQAETALAEHAAGERVAREPVEPGERR